jgi:hypothetical protein
MTGSLVIDPRFCGPPDSGNGGYVSGLIAGYLGGQAEVTLRRPTPLDVPLAVERAGAGTVRLLDGGALVAEGQAGSLTMEIPPPVPIAEARAARDRSWLGMHPDEHPFPACFVCGPERKIRDGLCITVGKVAGRDLFAGPWHPDDTLAGPGGEVRPEFLWAALDCPGGIGAFGEAALNGPPYLLGRFSVRQLGPVRAGKPHIVLGWRLGENGRKLMAGSALFTAAGQAVGLARATWVRLG